MKNSKLTGIVITLLFMALLFSSCGNLITGDDDDESDFRDDITGSWYVSEFSDTFGQQNYVVEIKKSKNNPNEILLYNFFNLGTSLYVTGKIVDETEIIIAEQEVDNSSIDGKGKIETSGKDILFTFNADFGNGKEEVVANFTNRPIASTKQERSADIL